MVTEAPDPRTFNTWEDAFQYPIPVVRKLEQQMRVNINENQEKLRSLVGANYRDLLGTAERIIEMDEQMRQAESILGTLGRKCNSRVLDRIGSNYAKLDRLKTQENAERLTLASQLAVLQACQDLIRRVVSTKRSPLLAAKLLVLSRLLHKSLSRLPDAPPFVGEARIRLGSLRRRVLNRIDRSMLDPDLDRAQLLECMCAFSLATSSTPTDILRHFQHARLEAITDIINNQHTSQDDILKAFKLYITTLHDTASIIPGGLADELAKLKTRPLFLDPDVRALDELDLGVHEQWLPDDVSHFTPWPRHDELQKLEADRLVKLWAKEALYALLQGMRLALSHRNDFKALLDLRREVLESLLSSRIRAAGLDIIQLLEDVRSALTSQLVRVPKSRAIDLHLVMSEISDTLTEWDDEASKPSTSSLWDTSLLSMELSSGAKDFVKAIIDRRHGRTSPVLRVVAAYESWAKFINEAYRVIRQMKETKWDDDYVDEEPGLEVGPIEKVLSEDDPKEVELALDAALRSALSKMEVDLQSRISELDGAKHRGEKAIFLIRVLREMRQRLKTLATHHPHRKLQDFGVSLVPSLHHILASYVSVDPLGHFSDSIKSFVASPNLFIRALWAGTPPLPVQPSPEVFRLLHRLVKQMAGCGEDLWAKDAVQTLKVVLRKRLGATLKPAVEDLRRRGGREDANGNANVTARGTSEGEDDANQPIAELNTNAEVQSNKPVVSEASPLAHLEDGTVDERSKAVSSLQREKLIQVFFDILYLSRALALSQGKDQGDDALSSMTQSLENDALVNGAGLERLRKASMEYWKKTYLLFALLA